MSKDVSRYVFCNRFFLHEIETLSPIKNFKVLVFMQMLYVAAYGVELAHQVLMARSDKQFSATFELPRSAARL